MHAKDIGSLARRTAWASSTPKSAATGASTVTPRAARAAVVCACTHVAMR